MIRLSRGMDHL